jgi:hypothetical protein
METGMTEAEHTAQLDDRSLMAKLLAGEYGLAITYWVLYFAGASLFFYFGTLAVDNEQWLPYLGMVAGILAYTFLLILGIRSAYRGPQLWKVMSRTSSIFMIINVLVGISTLGFIY